MNYTPEGIQLRKNRGYTLQNIDIVQTLKIILIMIMEGCCTNIFPQAKNTIPKLHFSPRKPGPQPFKQEPLM